MQFFDNVSHCLRTKTTSSETSVRHHPDKPQVVSHSSSQEPAKTLSYRYSGQWPCPSLPAIPMVFLSTSDQPRLLQGESLQVRVCCSNRPRWEQHLGWFSSWGHDHAFQKQALTATLADPQPCSGWLSSLCCCPAGLGLPQICCWFQAAFEQHCCDTAAVPKGKPVR